MIRTVLTMRVKQGSEDSFQRTWSRAAADISSLPGQRGQSLLRDLGEPVVFTVTADWASTEDLQRFQGSPQRIALSAALEELRESASKTVVEVLETIEATEEVVSR